MEQVFAKDNDGQSRRSSEQLEEASRKKSGATSVPCLVCGDCGEEVSCVKVEADDGDNQNDDLLIDNHRVTGGSLSLPSQDASLEATNDITDAVKCPRVSFDKWTEDEKCAYQWFMKWFKIPLTKKEKGSKFANYGWDGDSGKDPFPFCKLCRIQLMELLEFQRNVEELERAIRTGIERMKVQAISFEGAFEKNGIYEKDGRYKRVRKLIVADFVERYPNEQRKKTESSRKSVRTRRSGRSVVANHNPQENDPSCSENVPLVLVSTADKTNADEHLALNWIKQESTEPNTRSSGSHTDGIQIQKRVPKSSPRLTKTHSNPVGNTADNDAIGTRNDDNSHCDNNPNSVKRSGRRRRTVPIPVLDLDDAWEDDRFHDDLSSNPPDNIDGCNPATPPHTKIRKRKEKAVVSKVHSKLENGPSPKRKRMRKEEDEDWQLEASSDEDEEGDNDHCNPDYDINTGKRKNTKSKEDLEKGTIVYKNLVYYLREPYANNMVECSKCKTVIKKMNIRAHYVRKHTDTYACKLCSFRSARASELKSHVATAHEGVPPVRKICEICGKPCTKQSIWLHMWSHKNAAEREEALARGGKGVPAAKVKKHQCDECGRPFPSKYGLRRHKERMHSSEEAKESRMELCPECGGTYLSLRCHRQVVHGVFGKRYTCLEEGCGKEFKTLHFLTQHKDGVHRKIRPYKCTMCPREFTKEKLLKNHMNLHMGIRPWPCEYCPMAFVTKGNRKRHTDVYHSEGSNPKRKPFARGPAMLASDVRKKTLISEGKYLPPSALATWAAGREPTSHFLPGTFPGTLSVCPGEGNE